MINAYCYSQLGNKNNFGKIIEKNKLHEKLATNIKNAIESPDSLIEDTILDFFTSNHAVFGLDEKFPSDSEREVLKKGFREYYQAVQLDSTSHFDEFVLCLPEQKTASGCGYIFHSKIVSPFSKVELTTDDCNKIIAKANVTLCGDTPIAMRNALALAFGYVNLNLLVHSMDLRVTELVKNYSLF